MYVVISEVFPSTVIGIFLRFWQDFHKQFVCWWIRFGKIWLIPVKKDSFVSFRTLNSSVSYDQRLQGCFGTVFLILNFTMLPQWEHFEHHSG